MRLRFRNRAREKIRKSVLVLLPSKKRKVFAFEKSKKPLANLEKPSSALDCKVLYEASNDIFTRSDDTDTFS